MVPKTQITPNISPMETPTAFRPSSKSDLQPLVKVLCDLIDLYQINWIPIYRCG